MSDCKCHSCEILPILHEQIAEMCEYLGKNRKDFICDSWNLFELIKQQKRQLDQLKSEVEGDNGLRASNAAGWSIARARLERINELMDRDTMP